MDTLPHNDQPIASPTDDRFGIDPFARALASSIRKLKTPTGSVIALNGPWGTGNSSAVNLVRHHLMDAVNANEMVVIDFNCWWFRGEEALALAFFRELYAGLAPSLGEKIKKALPKLGARLLGAGSAIGGVADLAGAGGIGAAAGGAMEWLGDLIKQDESVEKLHRELSKALADQDKRFLIVIDDIDRLSPEEALLIFRLVKSVGRLPNVLYLLVYDRQLAEKIVSERYPSEGPHYLEKIVQAAFELPEPAAVDLQNHLLTQIEAICGQPGEEQIGRFMNIFYEGIASAIRTPRDVARLMNSLSVTWPAVAGEVNLADFLALDVLRLLHPTVYRSIRQNKELVCRSEKIEGREREPVGKRYQETLLGSVKVPDVELLRRMLMRLFPVLESVWANMSYGEVSARLWAAERRVCSMDHFDSYFRFAVGDDVLLSTEMDEFIQRSGDMDFVTSTMRHALTVARKAGGTKAAVLLTELNTHADRIGKDLILPLLTALFAVADEINVPADAGRGLSFSNNELRLHWLMRRLILERLTLPERSDLLTKACETASLGWLSDLASSAWHDYHPGEGKYAEPPENCLTTEADAAQLRSMLLDRILEAAKVGALADHSDMASLLYLWSDLAGDDGAATRAWTADLYASDVGVKQLAIAFTSFGWSQGMGDAVAKRFSHVRMKGTKDFVDLDVFRKRVEEAAVTDSTGEIKVFLEAWQRAERGDQH